MTERHLFNIAGFILAVNCPEGWDLGNMLPSFMPFLYDGRLDPPRCLLQCDVFPVAGDVLTGKEETLLEETANDMGTVRLYARPYQYRVELACGDGNPAHCMVADKDFSTLKIYVARNGREGGHALSSLIRIAYSQAILYHDSLAIHAAAVFQGGKSYLFMGKSGTGKSTHARLWMEHIPGTGLLNDDNPAIRVLFGKAYAFGTPWSGKTPCYRPWFFPVGGMVRLVQAPENRFALQEGGDAFAAVYPGCSAIIQDEALRGRLYDTVARLADEVPVGTLECRPEKEAAILCHKSLLKAQNRT